MKVKYTGSTDDQVNWGHGDDPRPLLIEGHEYELQREEVHSWHTLYHLVSFPGHRFNSCCFDPSRIKEGWDEYNSEKESR